jgi:RNA-directed DNA polymerase
VYIEKEDGRKRPLGVAALEDKIVQHAVGTILNQIYEEGSVISPLLANIYLHYCFDLWVNVWRKKGAQGEVVVVRYADDTVLGFQYQADADRFLENLKERLAVFGLELHPEKTRRIEFGRYAEKNRKRRDEGKPETFDFLGLRTSAGRTV